MNIESKNNLKKVQKKIKRLQHIVSKESGVNANDNPSEILSICNAGLSNGLTEERIIENFKNFGFIENIVLLPGKSCSFIKYRQVNSAVKAFTTINGNLCIGQDDKPIYLSYVDSLPEQIFQKEWQLPPGLILIENFISEAEEELLLKLCTFDVNKEMKHRNVKHYGFEFRYDINNVDKKSPLEERLPRECEFIWKRLEDTGKWSNFQPDQLTINQYQPGQGIPFHVDTHSAFEDPLISLSLNSSIVMEFKKANKHYCVLLPRRSLAIMSGECRYDWTHGIVPRKFDVIRSECGLTNLPRKERISFTFRKVLQQDKCTCQYPTLCDSKNKDIESTTANEVEKLHVHEVYENIANHFSDTRHTPWPNVLEFVQSFHKGAILIDIGCGNGKYLGLNKNSFNIGCDRSFNLIDVCKKRGFEAFTTNCLNLPLKDEIADGLLSIAVIHHLANEERRMQAIKEMVRVLRVGGRALIYVWAKDQAKDQEKSSYLKQDRKNRKSITETTTVNNNENISIDANFKLPVHINRTQFQHSDVLVPWKLKKNSEVKDANTFLRFYHVFQEGELELLCSKFDNCKIVKSYYDQGNWCIVIEKIKH